MRDGFTFPVSDWQKAVIPPLWHGDVFRIEMGTTPDGTPYHAVLRSAAQRMETLIKDAKEFDIVIDVPELASASYPRTYHVARNARSYRYEFLRFVPAPYYVVFAVLIVFLVAYRTYRTVRWVRRRASEDNGQPG
jgi:hypothetical protein